MKYIKFFILAGLMIALFGCEFTTPKSVRIKSDPTITIPLGTRENIFRNDIELDTELEELTMETIDGQPNEDYVEGLSIVNVAPGQPKTVHLSTAALDISVSDFAGETLQLDNISQTIDPVDFTVPDLDFADQTIGIDPLPIQGDMVIPSIEIPNIPEETGTPPPLTSPTISATGYDSVTFSQGTLNIDVTINDSGTPANVRIDSARIVSGGVTVVDNAGAPSVTLPDTISFNMAGITLPSSFEVEFTVEVVSGGGFPETFDLTLDSAFSGDTTISAAQGLLIDETITGSVTIPLGDIQAAEVAAGSLGVTLNFPPAWGITTQNIDLDLTQNAASLGTASGSGSAVMDLAGMILGPQDLILNYTVVIYSADADFSVVSNIGTATAGITDFTSLDIYYPDLDFGSDLAVTQTIDQEIQDIIASADLIDPAITVSLTNGLPVDLTLTLDSPVLGLNSDTMTFAGNSAGSTTETLYLLGSIGDGTPVTLDIDALSPGNTISFTAGVSSPDYVADVLSLGSVTVGQTYSLSGDVSVSLEIDSVTLNTVTYQGQFPEAPDALDLSQLSDFLPADMEFQGITSQFVTDLPAEVMDNLSLRVTAVYGAGATRVDLVSGSEPGGRLSLDGSAVPPINLDTILNDRPADLYFEYDVEATGVTINVSGTDETISASLETDIPLQIAATAPTEMLIDGAPVIETPTEDIFGRQGATQEEIDEINESLAFARSVSLVLNITNNVLVGDDGGTPVYPYLQITGPGLNEQISLQNGQQIITLEYTEPPDQTGEINNFINNDPYLPEFHLMLPQGLYSVDQWGAAEDDFTINAYVEIQTRVDKVFDLEEEQ